MQISGNRGELLLTNARLFGLPDRYDAVFAQQGRIISIGPGDQLRRALDKGREIDLQGAHLLPGLGDAHLHLAIGGKSLGVINLGELNQQQVARELQRAAREQAGEDQWLVAFNWDRLSCDLDVSILDGMVADKKVVVYGRDIHSCCCNSAALAAGGITMSTPNPQGGAIGRNAEGGLNGILYEDALALIGKLLPSPDEQLWRRYILEGQKYLLSLGLTAVGEVLETQAEPIYRRLDEEGGLILDVDGWRRLENWDGVSSPPPDGGRFRVRTLKLFLDGAFGSRTAALDAPYDDQPDQRGVLFYSDEALIEKLLPAVQAGWRLAVHALGDRALAQAARVLQKLPQSLLLGPHRIEHAQLLPMGGVEDVLRSKALLSIQPVHMLDDQRWIRNRIGVQRCGRSFIWGSLLKAGGELALGSDWPVASPDPLLNLHIAINRCDFNGTPNPLFDAGEALSPQEAIRAATYGWAAAAGMRSRRGALEEGQIADFTVVKGISDDLRDWSQAKVLLTICRGEVVYEG